MDRNHKFRIGCSWIFSVVCLCVLPTYGFCVGSIIILLLGIIALPIKPIQKLWEKVPIAKKWFKPVCLGVIFCFSVCGLPQKDVDQVNKDNEIKTAATNGYSHIEKEVTIVVTRRPAKSTTEEPTASPTKKPAKKADKKLTKKRAKKPTKKSTKKPTPTEKVTEQSNESIVANKNTKAYHRLSCSRLPNEENRVYFNSETEANAAGYDNPCDYCNP